MKEMLITKRSIRQMFRSMVRQFRRSEERDNTQTAWFSLPNDRTLEIKRCKLEFPEEMQDYDFRVHCAEREKDCSHFRSTNGIVDEVSVPAMGFSETEFAIIYRWAVQNAVFTK